MSSFLTIIPSAAGPSAAGPSAAGPSAAAGPSEAVGPKEEAIAGPSAAGPSAEAGPKEPAAGPKEEAIAAAGPKEAAIAFTPKKSQTKVVPKDNDACPICMDAIGNTNCAKTSCGHSFCLSCIIECLNTNHVCPLCRKDIMEKKERSGKKLKMDSAVQIIEEEMEIFGLHQQLAMARQFGIRALKTVVQSFALSTAHSIAIMQDETDVDGSWEEIEEEDEDDSDADESDADEDEEDGEVEEDEEEEEDTSAADPSAAQHLQSQAQHLQSQAQHLQSQALAVPSTADPRVSIFDRLGPIREE